MVQGAIEAAAAQQAVISQLEIEHQALLSELGPENSRTIATERALETARAAQRRLLGGQEQVLPISMAQLPRLSGEYARLYQDLLIQKTLMEEARPLLEQARFDEERDRVAVQVLDPAVPPVRKAKPKRAFIVLAATGSAFALTVILALLVEGYRRRRPMIMASLAAARARS